MNVRIKTSTNSRKSQTKMSYYPIKRDKADATFSDYVRMRDGVCVYPNCARTKLECSHYWNRGKESTRFEPINAEGLCHTHHEMWEHQKEIKIGSDIIMGEYAQFKIKQLGQKEYDRLKVLAHTTVKKDRVMALIKCKELLKQELQRIEIKARR